LASLPGFSTVLNAATVVKSSAFSGSTHSSGTHSQYILPWNFPAFELSSLPGSLVSFAGNIRIGTGILRGRSELYCVGFGLGTNLGHLAVHFSNTVYQIRLISYLSKMLSEEIIGISSTIP